MKNENFLFLLSIVAFICGLSAKYLRDYPNVVKTIAIVTMILGVYGVIRYFKSFDKIKEDVYKNIH